MRDTGREVENSVWVHYWPTIPRVSALGVLFDGFLFGWVFFFFMPHWFIICRARLLLLHLNWCSLVAHVRNVFKPIHCPLRWQLYWPHTPLTLEPQLWLPIMSLDHFKMYPTNNLAPGWEPVLQDGFCLTFPLTCWPGSALPQVFLHIWTYSPE